MSLTLALREINEIKERLPLINTKLCSFRPPLKLMTLVTEPLI
ncbi:hypothetical protein SAMN05216524_102169 [Mucilaginibacter sp. OK098]|nr:hypothetical protein SAMN05216524_102169 [Mucilaginibacter sp. OK098]